MHEDFKIQEAEYHLRRLHQTQGQEAFPFELSAFMTAARSVLQYALEEAKPKPGGATWYESQVNDPVVKFFRARRNSNVHVAPIDPAMNTQVTPPAGALGFQGYSPTLQTSQQLSADPMVVEQTVIPPSDPLRSINVPSVSYSYRFKDWSGSEDVLTLCLSYLDRIKSIVASGRSQGLLTQ
jgi:hypothetical protein